MNLKIESMELSAIVVYDGLLFYSMKITEQSTVDNLEKQDLL